MPPPLLSRLHAHRAALCVLSHLVAFVAVILGFALTALFRSQVPILIAGLFAFAAFVWRWGLFLIVLWYGPGGVLRRAFIEASQFWIAWLLKSLRLASFVLIPAWFAVPFVIPLALLS
jgi:hypothetical protein